MRHNFTTKTKKAALARSGGRCEAYGKIYGLEDWEWCNRPLAVTGVEYDHYPLPAHADDSAGLANCVAVCPRCHAYKTRTFDIPVEAKIKRIRRANGPVENRKRKAKIRTRPGQKMPSRGFEKRAKP